MLIKLKPNIVIRLMIAFIIYQNCLSKQTKTEVAIAIHRLLNIYSQLVHAPVDNIME